MHRAVRKKRPEDIKSLGLHRFGSPLHYAKYAIHVLPSSGLKRDIKTLGVRLYVGGFDRRVSNVHCAKLAIHVLSDAARDGIIRS